jgi:hypothetical protein
MKSVKLHSEMVKLGILVSPRWGNGLKADTAISGVRFMMIMTAVENLFRNSVREGFALQALPVNYPQEKLAVQTQQTQSFQN